MSDKKCVNIAVLTVSDTRTDADDKSGQVLVERIKDAGHHLVEKIILFITNSASPITTKSTNG